MRKPAAVMRFIMVTAFAILTAAWQASAQEQHIRLKQTELSAGELFAEIERQTGLLFAINHANFDTSRILTVPSEGGVTELVRTALAGTSMTYRITGKHILIVPRREEPRKRSDDIVPDKPFYDLSNRVYDNPDFERDLAVYNASVADRNFPDEIPATHSDSIRIIYVPKIDSMFAYSDTTFPLGYTKTGASLPEGMAYLKNAPAKLTLKTNLLYGAASLTPNLSLEAGLGRRTSLGFTGSYNPWDLKGTHEDNTKLVHWMAKAEFRYWLCERSYGHFFGANAFYWQYNISGYRVPFLFEKEYRYEGNAWGAGLTYGYHLPLADRWGLEFSAGAGLVFMNYNRYTCEKCNRDREALSKIYFGPTELGVKLVFIIK